TELERRNIDRQLEMSRPVTRLDERFLPHPHGERADLSGLLRDGDELGRFAQAAWRRVPPRQHLEPVELARVEADQRLEEWNEFIGFDRGPDFIFKSNSRLELLLHLAVEPGIAVAA